jgi:DNA-binding beta-propeller fold protein YncE
MTRIRNWAWPALLVLFVGHGGAAESDAPAYKVVKTIKVGGDGNWDYLTMDAAARRLYISRATRVMVLDVDTGKVVGEVAKTPGVHGIALAPKHKRGFTSNGGEATVTVFDLETLRETARVKVGNRPDAIIYDPASDRVFTFNAGSKDATAIDAKDATVAGAVKLDGKPEFAVADEKGMVYVNIEDKNEIVAIDSHKLSVKARWSLAPGEGPSGLSMDRAKRRLFSTCRNQKMVVLDADSGKVLGTAPIGKGTDACVFDAKVGLAFSSNGDGTLTIVEEKDGKFNVVDNVKTQERAKTMALDTKTHNVLLAAAKFKAGAGRRTVEPDSFVILVVGK